MYTMIRKSFWNYKILVLSCIRLLALPHTCRLGIEHIPGLQRAIWECNLLKLTKRHPLRVQHLANLPVKLIPIRLDLELEGVKLQDSFTWNLNGLLLSLIAQKQFFLLNSLLKYSRMILILLWLLSLFLILLIKYGNKSWSTPRPWKMILPARESLGSLMKKALNTRISESSSRYAFDTWTR